MELGTMIKMAVRIFKEHKKEDINLLALLLQKKCKDLLFLLPNISNEMIEIYLKSFGVENTEKALKVINVLRASIKK